MDQNTPGMKAFTKTTSLFLLIAISFSLFAQHTEDRSVPKKIIVKDITKAISKGTQPGLEVKIYQADKKDVEKEWSKRIRQNTKSKVEEENNEIYITETYLDPISSDPVNVYSIINEYRDYIELNAFFELKDKFITKANNETEYLGAKKLVREFALQMYKEAVENELKEEEKKLKDMEGDLKKLVNENDKLHKNISQNERDIDKNEEDIKMVQLDQERVMGQIQQKKDQLLKLRDEDQKKEAEKDIKSLEKDLSKLEKDEESMHKDIDNSEADIREYERNIDDNEMAMERKQKEIDGQKALIFQVKKKLESIE